MYHSGARLTLTLPVLKSVYSAACWVSLVCHSCPVYQGYRDGFLVLCRDSQLCFQRGLSTKVCKCRLGICVLLTFELVFSVNVSQIDDEGLLSAYS